jgi:putative ABC transport system permease protein
MAALRQFFLRLIALIRNGIAERELGREIAAHLSLLEDEFIAKGMAPADAKIAARRAFGGVEQAKEYQRDARSFRWIDDARRDIAYAVRSLLRSPSFTIAAVLTIAIGIGATTAIYSVIDRVLLEPLPFPDGDQLIVLREPERAPTTPGLSYSEYLEWRARTTTLSGLATLGMNPQVILPTREGTARLTGGISSTNYFEVLGVKAAIGRTFVSADDANPDVVVLSHHTWQTHFRSDPAAVGSVIELRGTLIGTSNADARPGASGRLLIVLGVLPADMEHLGVDIDFYTPLVLAPGGRAGAGTVRGRLRDGVSLTEANEEANVIGNAVRPPRPASDPPLTRPRFAIEPLKDGVVSEIKPALRVFLTAVAVVLLIVCANVANLLLARGSARGREIAVRLALGASRARVVRQILTECLVLALVGGTLGAGIGAAGVSLIKKLATIDAQGVFRFSFGGNLLPRINEVGVDWGILGIALGLSIVASLVFGVLPALHLSRTNHLQAMGSRGVGVSQRESRTRLVLVVSQLVMATVLLVGAGLLASSFLNLSRVEKGYDPANALSFYLVLPAEYSIARKAETIESLLSRLRNLPGVEAAGFAYAGILLGLQDTVGDFAPPGRSISEIQEETKRWQDGSPVQIRPRLKSVSQGYFEAMGVALLAGRTFNGQDSATATPAVIVNRTVARRFFGDDNPVGQTLTWASGNFTIPVQIVGVVEDVRQGRVATPPYAEIFMDYRQIAALYERAGAPKLTIERLAFGFLSFGVRTRGNLEAVIPAVRQAVRGVDVNAGIDAILPMEQMVANSVARQRFYAVMLSVFAGTAGLLAAIGIYGVLAYAVIQRTQEIGVRMALGAERRQVMALILRRGLVVALAGITVGLAGAYAGARYMQSMLFGVEPRDPGTFIAVAVAFAIVTVIASYLPARRATRVDPMVALRVE